MKLVALVEYLANPNRLGELYQEKFLNAESEALLIYMKDTLDLESEVVILEIEETEDDILFEKGEVKYIQLFPVDHAVDLIENDLELKGRGFSNLQVATRLLEYRKNDA